VTSDGASSIAPMAHASPSVSRVAAGISLEQLGLCVRRLDPGTRALLDLSVRRRLRDDDMAPMLRTDPFHLAWRRARALERVAGGLGGDPPPPLSEVRAALAELPDELWSPLAQLMPPAPAPSLALVPRSETATDLEVRPHRVRAKLVRFAEGAPPLRTALKSMIAAVAGATLRPLLWRRPWRAGSSRAGR
jgi:hypothetical protein